MHKRCINTVAVAMMTASMLMSTGSMAAMPVMAAGETPATSPAAVAGVSGEQIDVAATQTVTVSGLRSGSTVKLYQIVDGYYKDGKLVKYVLMDPTNGKIAAIGNDEKGQNAAHNDIITEDEITTIANNIQSGAFTADPGVDMTVGTTADSNGLVSATASVEPGLYMVLATDPQGEMVYNPAVVAVNITDVNNNTAAGGSVDMTQFFTTNDGTTDSHVYLKSSNSADNADKKMTGTKKAAVQAEGETAEDGKTVVNAHGDTIAIGDTVHFQIDGIKIPSYSADFTAPFYNITDTIDNTFDKIDQSKIDVTVGGVKVAASTDTAKTYTITDNGGSGFKITFDTDYIKSLRGQTDAERAVVVKYDAVLNSTAGLNFAENHNRATISYSNNPSDATGAETITKDTYDYTFGIGAKLDGQETTGSGSQITPVFVKTTANGDAHVNEDGTTTVTNPLAGATFTLYSDEACQNIARTVNQPEGTAESDANGNISFTGLDEGTYYLKETKAPAGYALADQTYQFVIMANIGTDGIMKDYSIKTSYKDATHSTWTDAAEASYTSTANKGTDGSVTNTITRNDAPVVIQDARLQSLPSTGGRGTIVITLVALAGMTGFVIIHKASRKADAQ